MKQRLFLPAKKSAQQGATLLITMVFMLLISMIAVSSLTSSTQQTKLMASISRKDATFQENESAAAQLGTNLLFPAYAELFTTYVSDKAAYTNKTLNKVGSSPMSLTTEMRYRGTRNSFGSSPSSVREAGGTGGIKLEYHIIEIRSSTSYSGSDLSTTTLYGIGLQGPEMEDLSK